ncbi:alpha-mannosidase [Granulicella sp. 5B5]|uniref:alpha-mannosidase n=1 Tax=Granulicella sp. 5B5 TaxID=1617967 RepID=UPI0015F53177|nr:glycoside hydrolase family 38 C-terminal domain-containing protein [Granulicella sp. 5B5]QMV19947.1 alpha-mannosidase [Granulicella sp. 5B5]
MRFRVLTLALALTSSLAFAQSFTPVREQKNLSPSAIAKLHTLETLNALPGGAWRFHAGDIPHGESISLDDSSWPLVQTPEPRHSVKAPKDAVWYRRTIEVPKTLNGYDLTGSTIWFQFRADANGPMPQIIYFNGRRVALGDDLEPIVLFEPAHPGDKVLVAVKLLHTVDDKSFTGVNMKIVPPTGGRPNPDDIRIECLTAANLLPALPAPRKDLLPTVEQAIAAIDTKALAAGNQQAFDDSLRKAQQTLDPLHSVLATAKVDLTGNSHIDAAWLWPRSETIDVVKRTFTTALQLMNEYPDYTYTQSAAQYSEWMADKYPALNEQIAQRIKQGRWEIVGGMWVEPDLNLPGGESLVRQILVGQREFQKLYGVTATIGWNPDSFGYNWQLPQIYKRSGIDYFVTQKMHWNDTNQLPFRLFWWESPDGSKVLTYFPTDYVHDNVNPSRISADYAESAERNPGTFEHMDLYGIGDHGGGPTRDMLDQADHWIAAGKTTQDAVPTMRYSTAQHYFDDVQTHLNPNSPTWNYDSIAKGYTAPPADAKGDVGIPTWDSELYFEYHRGVFTTQAKHKQNMRRSETATLNAEKYASLAWLDGDKYPNDVLTENWKKITFNQFHDLAAGSGIAVIYRDAQKDYTEVFNADKLIDDKALSTIDASIDTRGKVGVPVIVNNTMAWPRTELVKLHVELPEAANAITLTDAKGTVIPSQITNHVAGTDSFDVLVRVENVPALGYTVLHAESANSEAVKPDTADLRVDDTGSAYTLSNAHLKLSVDKEHGCITSLTEQGTEYFAPHTCGNQLETYVDKPKNYDAWNVDPGTYDVPFTPIDHVDSIKVVEDGPLRKTIRIERTWQSSHFTQDISLDAGADFVRVANDVDWHETHVLLKAAFPLAASGPKATYEIPYGAIERTTTRNNSWEKAQFEVPAQRWADLGDSKQGVSIINNSKYGYDGLNNVLRLTLLRSPIWPDPDADRGKQHFTYEIYPHTGTWQHAETVHRGYELNTPLTAEQVFSHTGTLPATHSFAAVDNPNVVLSAVKKAEDSNALIFRMYEATGQGTDVHLHIPAGAEYAVETNLMETPLPNAQHLSISGDTINLPIKPWEIRTLEVVYPKK